MDTKHQVHNLIILDESGSMGTIKHSIIQGFNEVVQTIKGIGQQYPEQDHFVTLISFNGLAQKTLHFMDPVERLEQINSASYQPAASTPLFDAMGFSFAKLRKVLQNTNDYNVLVTILTDGEENASKEYTVTAIKRLIEELKEQSWTFTYIGTDHDVEKIALSISISNVMSFTKSEAGIQDMFSKEKAARSRFSQRIRMKEDTSNDFYDKS